MNPEANIVIMDDTPANLTLLSHILNESGYRVRPFPRGTMAVVLTT